MDFLAQECGGKCLRSTSNAVSIKRSAVHRSPFLSRCLDLAYQHIDDLFDSCTQVGAW